MSDVPNGRQHRADGEQSRARIVAFIRTYTAEHGRLNLLLKSPSYKEIGAHVGLSAPTVLHHLRILERRGVLVIGTGPRAVTLLEDTGGAT